VEDTVFVEVPLPLPNLLPKGEGTKISTLQPFAEDFIVNLNLIYIYFVMPNLFQHLKHSKLRA